MRISLFSERLGAVIAMLLGTGAFVGKMQGFDTVKVYNYADYPIQATVVYVNENNTLNMQDSKPYLHHEAIDVGEFAELKRPSFKFGRNRYVVIFEFNPQAERQAREEKEAFFKFLAGQGALPKNNMYATEFNIGSFTKDVFVGRNTKGPKDNKLGAYSSLSDAKKNGVTQKAPVAQKAKRLGGVVSATPAVPAPAPMPQQTEPLAAVASHEESPETVRKIWPFIPALSPAAGESQTQEIKLQPIEKGDKWPVDITGNVDDYTKLLNFLSRRLGVPIEWLQLVKSKEKGYKRLPRKSGLFEKGLPDELKDIDRDGGELRVAQKAFYVHPIEIKPEHKRLVDTIEVGDIKGRLGEPLLIRPLDTVNTVTDLAKFIAQKADMNLDEIVLYYVKPVGVMSHIRSLLWSSEHRVTQQLSSVMAELQKDPENQLIVARRLPR